jgi:LysM repeat protein
MNDDGELPPVLDLETADGQPKNKIISRAKVWLDEVENAFGRKPIIYSGQYFLQDNFSESNGLPPSWIKNYPLWLAQYPNNYIDGSSKPFLPRGWSAWTFWQYSEKGRVSGINSSTDMNVFNGSWEDLQKFAGGQVVSEPPPATTPVKHTVVAGDTFETISTKYGMTINELVNVNPQLLKIGDQLTVWGNDSGSSGDGDDTAPPPERQIRHTVRSGETLFGIAIKYGTTVNAIVQANIIANPNLIDVGQVLIIPA